MPAESVATLVAANTAAPVPVDLYDQNDPPKGIGAIWPDPPPGAAPPLQPQRLFRCRRTHREAAIRPGTLAMLADIAERHPGKTIEYVSAYRVSREESATSPHRRATAIDFRIRGVQLRTIRDYLWRAYSGIGVGWYPEGQYIHMDSRPELHDTSWTFLHGSNHYEPTWAALARRPEPPPAHAQVAVHQRPGT